MDTFSEYYTTIILRVAMPFLGILRRKKRRKEEGSIDRKTVTAGLVGMAAVGAAAMLRMPKQERRVKKALKTVGAAVDSISRMIG